MFKSDDSETTKIVADFLVEDYRFQQSFVSAVNKLFNEEIKKYKSSYVFHTNKIKELSLNRHHFQDIEFASSSTGKIYRGTTGKDGTLCIIDIDTNTVVENNSKPSKREIVGQAIIDLGVDLDTDDTLYQRYRKLTRLINKSKES